MKKTLTLLAISMLLPAISLADYSVSTYEITGAQAGNNTASITLLIDTTWLTNVAVGQSLADSETLTLLSVGSVSTSTGYSSTDNIITSSGVLGSTTSAGTTSLGASNYYQTNAVLSYYEGTTLSSSSNTLSNIIGNVNWNDVDGVALTLVYDPSGSGSAQGTTIYLSYSLDGSVYTYSTYLAGLRASNETFTTFSVVDDYADVISSTTSLLSTTEAIAANMAALGVPEPATASLSLLGLGALLLRRRRH